MSTMIPAGANIDAALNKLDSLLEKTRSRAAGAQEPQPKLLNPHVQNGADELNFENPEELAKFMNSLHTAGEESSPFAQHMLDPARVAELLDLDLE